MPTNTEERLLILLSSSSSEVTGPSVIDLVEGALSAESLHIFHFVNIVVLQEKSTMFSNFIVITHYQYERRYYVVRSFSEPTSLSIHSGQFMALPRARSAAPGSAARRPATEPFWHSAVSESLDSTHHSIRTRVPLRLLFPLLVQNQLLQKSCETVGK